jgi:hypothetical protein
VSDFPHALDVWLLIAVNFLGFILGTIVTGISYYAYVTGEKKTALRNATVGFGLLTAGLAVEPAYQIGIEGSHVLASEQNVTLQFVEGVLFSLGFLVLFFSIYRYGSRSERRRITVNAVDDDGFEGSD